MNVLVEIFTESVVVQIIGFFLGMYLFWKGFSSIKLSRLVQNMPTSLIRSVAVGFVEITGVVKKAKEVFTAPLSGEKVVWYQLKIEEKRGSGKNSRWVTVRKIEQRAEFYCRDKTGKVLVRPQQAQCELKTLVRERSMFGMDPSKRVKQGLKKVGVSFEGFLGINKSMKYTEQGLPLDNKVYILGTAKPIKGRQTTRNEDNLFIGKGVNNPYFMISPKSEKQLLRSLGPAKLYVIFGPILSTACLAAMFINLGMI